TGGRAEQASNTARRTPESWRTCGSTTPDGASSKSIVPPGRREGIRPAGPLRTRRPARPFVLEARTLSNLGRETRRENADGCLRELHANLSRSFPRKRESRIKNWVPAFAGTSGATGELASAARMWTAG